MENKILTYDSVEISFDGEAVVHDVSFSLTPGEILGLVGESLSLIHIFWMVPLLR